MAKAQFDWWVMHQICTSVPSLGYFQHKLMRIVYCVKQHTGGQTIFFHFGFGVDQIKQIILVSHQTHVEIHVFPSPSVSSEKTEKTSANSKPFPQNALPAIQ